MHRWFVRAALVCLLIATATTASAQRGSKIYGRWRSSSGSIFDVSYTGDGAFSLTWTQPNGASEILRGQWVRGLRGTQFQYWHNGWGYTGTFSADDPDRIRVVATSNGSVSWWQREAALAPPPPPVAGTGGVFGSWRSTSGNQFDIGGGYRGLTVTVTRPSGEQVVMNGRWVFRGRQFQYWDSSHTYLGTFNSHDPNRIHILASDGSVNWWQRAFGPEPGYGHQQPYYERPMHMHRHRHRRAVACWRTGDTGCNRTKNGRSPMDATAFASFLGLVQSARPHIFPMKDRVQAGIANQYLTSLQLSRILDEFKPHVFPMLDVVKICAPHLVDPENGVGPVSQAFSPHTMVGTQAATVVSSQSSDPVP